MRLWVDDLRPPPTPDWLWAKTYAQAVYYISKYGTPPYTMNEISLDHDLGEERTGYDVAKFYAELVNGNWLPKPKLITVHSANPPGRENIQSVIDRYFK